jgi:hypothetical protein
MTSNLRSLQGECPSGTTSDPDLRQPAGTSGESPAPCPFCGAIDAPRLMEHDEIEEREVSEDDEGNDPAYAVCCSFHNDGCGATGPYDAEESLALEYWNRRASSSGETTVEPASVLAWAVRSFGPIALNRDERAARMAEEAVEVAQVEGVPLDVMQRITARVYSRPVGELGQEVGGLMVGLYALAARAGVDIDAEFKREFTRVLSKPADHWARKHAEKVAAGTADLTPVKTAATTPPASNLRTAAQAILDRAQAVERSADYLIVHRSMIGRLLEALNGPESSPETSDVPGGNAQKGPP